MKMIYKEAKEHLLSRGANITGVDLSQESSINIGESGINYFHGNYVVRLDDEFDLDDLEALVAYIKKHLAIKNERNRKER